MSKRLAGKVALITGAARGIGRAQAVRFAQEGAAIVALDICGPIETVVVPHSTPADLDTTAGQGVAVPGLRRGALHHLSELAGGRRRHPTIGVIMTDISKYGPWAVIAGGSEGAGAEFAKQLAADGFNLVLIARKPGPLRDTARQCREIGVDVRELAVDLLDPEGVSAIVAETADLEVGLLIYNAGANTCSEPFLDADLADFSRVIDLNVTRMLELVQHYARPMRERRRGGILLVGSMAATHGSMRQSVYTGVKAFSRLFAESLWLELRDFGVDVLELVLGVTRTPAMTRLGLNFDVPGLRISEPVDVAREGLEHLSDGPVFIAGGNAEAVHQGSGPDRAAIVLGAHRTVQELLGQK